RQHLRRLAQAIALPVDAAIEPLGPAAAVARGDAALVIAPGLLCQRLGQALLRLLLGDLLEGVAGHPATGRRGGLVLLDRHVGASRLLDGGEELDPLALGQADDRLLPRLGATDRAAKT